MIAFFSLKRGITTEINCDLTKKGGGGLTGPPPPLFLTNSLDRFVSGFVCADADGFVNG
jgi:hypothetical protein